MLTICCTSDLHGTLPTIPDCELLLLAGDYNPRSKGQNWWMRDTFAPWLESISARGISIIGVAGNHDYIFEKAPETLPALPWVYLQDKGHVYRAKDGRELIVYGSPWQPRFCDWAFNLDEPELAKKWEAIPDCTDILLLHGPPKGCCDKTQYKERIGSPSLLKRINEVRPKLVVCGHNHEGYGQVILKELAEPKRETRIVNCSHMDDDYRPVNPPIIIEL